MSNAQAESKRRNINERFVYQDDNAIEKPFNWKQMNRLGQYIVPYNKRLIPVILATIVGTATRVSIPFLIGFTIDHAIAGKNISMLLTITAIMLALYVIQLMMNRYRISRMNTIGQQVIYDLRASLFKHIQSLSFRFFDKRPAGSVLVRITNDINSLQELFTSGIVNLIVDMLQLAGIVIILLTINFKLGFAVMIAVPIMFYVSTNLRKKIR